MPRPRKEPANASAITTAPVSFSPGEGWFTVLQAIDYLGWKEDKIVSLRNAIKNRPEFQTDDAVRLVPIEGYAIAPLTYVSRDALDAYAAALQSGAAGSHVGRVSPKGKRYIVRVKDENLDVVRSALAQFGIDLEVASTPKKRKAKPAEPTQMTLDEAAPVNQDAEPVAS